jgi:hypothetical protein
MATHLEQQLQALGWNVERGVLEKNPGGMAQSDVAAVRLVQVPLAEVRGRWVMLGDEHPFVPREFRQNPANLVIGQMLQDLPHEADVRVRQRVFDDVQAVERNPIGAEGLVVVPNEALDNVDAHVVAALVGKLAADRKIPRSTAARLWAPSADTCRLMHAT